MSLFGVIDKMKNTSSEKDETRLVITVGRVMDTNDPNQMGRIRIYIPAIDRDTSLVGDLPFAMYCSPFSGHQQVQSRGPITTYTKGPVAYGLFSIPKVGTDVVVAHLDGNSQYRIWFGAIQGMYLSHTMPHGRFTFNNPGNVGTLDGPLSSTESPIQPMYDNLTGAYTRTNAVATNDTATDTTPRANFEWRSRGIDYQAAGLGASQRNSPTQQISNIADDRNYSFTEPDGNKFKGGNFTQGYAQSRIEPDVPYDPSLVDGGVNLDPQVYSLTTPGFHAWAMDDRPENCRMRFRTTSGHTIILDDTNERIYVATANGNNWVEMDQDGSIDIYSSRRVSIHAAMDVNIKTEGTFRVDAAQGIHLNSGQDVRITAGANTEITTTQTTNIASTGDMTFQTQGNLESLSTGNTNIEAEGDLNLQGQGNANMQAGTDMNLSASNNLNIEGSTVNILGDSTLALSATSLSLLGTATTTISSLADMNVSGTATFITGLATLNMSSAFFNGDHYTETVGIPVPPASPADGAQGADDATVPEPVDAYLNNRVPEHEPWGRIMMKQSATDVDTGANYQLELDYNSPEVGRMELGETIPRNTNWHR